MFWALIKNDQNQTEGVKSVHVCNVVLSLLFFQIHATLCKSLRQRLRWKTWSLRWWHCSRSCSRPRASWTRRKAWRRTCRTGWIRRQRFQIEKCGTLRRLSRRWLVLHLPPSRHPHLSRCRDLELDVTTVKAQLGDKQSVQSENDRLKLQIDSVQAQIQIEQKKAAEDGWEREGEKPSCTAASGTSALSWAALFHYKNTLISLLTTVFSLHVNTKK